MKVLFHRATAFLLVLFVVVIGGFVPARGFSAQGNGETMAVNYVDTPVKFRSTERTEWKKLSDTVGSLPEAGDVLVEDDGALGLGSGDSTDISLNERSGLTYRLSDDTADRIRLNHGSLKTTVEGNASDRSRLKLETPMGSLGIRGTEFGVSFERSGRSEVFVDTGLVALRTGGDRRGVEPGEYVAFGRDEGESDNRILEEGPLPDRYRLTWTRWSLKQRLDWLRRQRSQLRERIQSEAEGEERSSLRNQLERIEGEIDRLRNRYRPLNQRYRAYRERLEEQREDFIQERKEALNEYRRRRLREMREMERDQEKGIREMRERREEAMSNYQ